MSGKAAGGRMIDVKKKVRIAAVKFIDNHLWLSYNIIIMYRM